MGRGDDPRRSAIAGRVCHDFTRIYPLFIFNSTRSSEDKLANLAHRLKAPMSAQSQHLKKHLAEVLVPAVNLVREVHAVIDQNVDAVIGNGIMTFDQSCKKMERMVVSSKSALTVAYLKTQVSPTFSSGGSNAMTMVGSKMYNAYSKN